ncbi:MAG TPA: S8 family serine peptidase, partial [Solirubrobacterales bacterium]
MPGEVIVRFEPGASAAERRDARRGAGVRFEDSLGLPRAELVEVEGSVAAAVRRLESQPGVAYAQPNFRYAATAVEAPNDTFFDELWGLSDPVLPNPGVSVLEAWESGKGAGQVIAVLDTGVDLTHPDLEGNLWVNLDPDPIAEDVHGFDFVDDDGDPDDYQFHGTHVAGTAAAIAGDEKGIAGVAPEAEIMAVRVLDGDGEGSTSDIADGIEYAAENGAGVINMSLSGGAPEDKAMFDAVTLAATKDVVVVAAAGNDGLNNDAAPTTPCTLPQANLICVAALNKSGALAGFSNYGAKSVDLAAPGTSILSAKTDYGPIAPPFEDGFESGFPPIWEAEAFPGGIEWGLSSQAAVGAQSATDSPAPEQDYA